MDEYNDFKVIKTEKLYPFNSLGEGQFYAILQKGKEEYDINHKLSIKDFDDINLVKFGVSEYTYKDKLKIPTHESTHIDTISFENIVELDDDEVLKYLRGEELKKELNFNGYCKITYKKLGLGLAKYTNGTLKNHYPKGLRNLK